MNVVVNDCRGGAKERIIIMDYTKAKAAYEKANPAVAGVKGAWMEGMNVVATLYPNSQHTNENGMVTFFPKFTLHPEDVRAEGQTDLRLKVLKTEKTDANGNPYYNDSQAMTAKQMGAIIKAAGAGVLPVLDREGNPVEGAFHYAFVTDAMNSSIPKRDADGNIVKDENGKAGKVPVGLMPNTKNPMGPCQLPFTQEVLDNGFKRTAAARAARDAQKVVEAQGVTAEIVEPTTQGVTGVAEVEADGLDIEPS